MKDLTNLEELTLAGEKISGLTLKYLVNLKKLNLKDCPKIEIEQLFEVMKMSNLEEIIFCFYRSVKGNPDLINFLKRVENILKSRISAITLLFRIFIRYEIYTLSIKSESDSKILWEIVKEKQVKGEFESVYSICDINLFIEKLVEMSKRK